MNIHRKDEDGNLTDKHEYSSINNQEIGFRFHSNGFDLYAALFYFTTEGDAEKYGTVEAVDYLGDYFSKRWGFEAYYKRYKGMHLKNYKDFDLDEDVNEDEIYRGDMQLLETGLNLYFNILMFNDFSLLSGYNNIGLHKKNISGALVLSPSMQYTSIKAKDPIIAESKREDYGEFGEYQTSQIYSFTLSPGILLSFRIWKFYFNPSIFYGSGYERLKYNYSDYVSWNNHNNRLQMMFTLGFEGKRFFCSFKAMSNVNGFTHFCSESKFSLSNDRESYLVLASYAGAKLYAGIKF